MSRLALAAFILVLSTQCVKAEINTEELVNEFFKELEAIIKIEDTKTHEVELKKFYESRLSDDYKITKEYEYHFVSCHSWADEVHENSTVLHNKKDSIESTHSDAVRYDYEVIDFSVENVRTNTENTEVYADYALDLGGTIYRTPGRHNMDIEYAPFVDLRKCKAVFSSNKDGLKLKSEECDVVFKEGNIESWETKDFFKKSECGVDETEYSPKAKELLKHVALGNRNAQYVLALSYHFGRDGFQKDYNKAIEFYEKAANQGHISAQENLGILYYTGEGVPLDYTKAFEWFLKAAKLGGLKGQNNVGYMYRRGEGVEKNREEALKWLKIAADRGHEEAIRELGEMMSE